MDPNVKSISENSEMDSIVETVGENSEINSNVENVGDYSEMNSNVENIGENSEMDSNVENISGYLEVELNVEDAVVNSKMDPSVESVIEKYQNILKEKIQFKVTHNRLMLGQVGTCTRFFILELCRERELFLDFLKELSLLKSNSMCSRCGTIMRSKKKKISDGGVWICGKTYSENGKRRRCYNQKTFRAESWFSQSNLTLEEIFLLTFEIVIGTKTSQILEQYSFNDNTCAFWRHSVNEIIFEFVQRNKEIIGGVEKIVEVVTDESKCGKRKYGEGKLMDQGLMLGGIERGSGKFFLIEVIDESSASLIHCLKKWIKPGTSIYCPSWRVSEALGKEECKRLEEIHNVKFFDKAPALHTTSYVSMEKIWTHIKFTLPTYTKHNNFHFHIAMWLFDRYCIDNKMNLFTKFLDIIRRINFNERKKLLPVADYFSEVCNAGIF